MGQRCVQEPDHQYRMSIEERTEHHFALVVLRARMRCLTLSIA